MGCKEVQWTLKGLSSAAILILRGPVERPPEPQRVSILPVSHLFKMSSGGFIQS